MTPSLSFDHRPDPELGAALRAALDGEDQAAFVARVLTRAEHGPLPRADAPTWDVLAGWARLGIVAAAAAALVAGLFVGRTARTGSSLDDVVIASAGEGATAMLSSPRAPDASVVFASLVERQR
jgi:hypothetical protein